MHWCCFGVAARVRGVGLGQQLLKRVEACAAVVNDYYEDHSPALRLEKTLLTPPA